MAPEAAPEAAPDTAAPVEADADKEAAEGAAATETLEDKMAARAARFGLPVQAKPSDVAGKLKARADRFGSGSAASSEQVTRHEVIQSSVAVLSDLNGMRSHTWYVDIQIFLKYTHTVQAEKAAARAARFGIVTKEDAAAKLKARSDRFGTAKAAGGAGGKLAVGVTKYFVYSSVGRRVWCSGKTDEDENDKTMTMRMIR